ncbi:MAG: DUF1207 domain-containing protein [Desulfobulbaceae bacterium]|jgi:hypothetical protein|nr:DUF1207 domain-containing protein [Desulfobulbaceae bacterium]
MERERRQALSKEERENEEQECGHANPGRRRLRLMAEWYEGFAPHGQFYNNKVQYYGLGVFLGF